MKICLYSFLIFVYYNILKFKAGSEAIIVGNRNSHQGSVNTTHEKHKSFVRYLIQTSQN